MSQQTFDPGKIAFEWWQTLKGDPAAAEHWQQKGDPGALARLRRAATPVEALAEAQAVFLARRLGASPHTPAQLARIGALAHVLAHVRENDQSAPMARLLGPDRSGENAAMSPLRFQRLVAARTPAELMRQMRSAVKLLKARANIPDLARAIYWWGDTTRIRWTYEYWDAGQAAPDLEGTIETATVTANEESAS